MKFLKLIKRQAQLDAFHATKAASASKLAAILKPKPEGQKTIGELISDADKEKLIKTAIAEGKTTFTVEELETGVLKSSDIGYLKPGYLKPGKIMPLEPAILGPNSIEQQVADGVAKALMSVPKEDPGTVYKAMKMLHDLGFFVIAAHTHTAAGTMPEITLTIQQSDVDKLMLLVEHCSGKVHY